MIDDANSPMTARFVELDFTVENMRLLKRYLEKYGRPLSFYTDKAALFTSSPKPKRGELAGIGGCKTVIESGRSADSLFICRIRISLPLGTS